MNGYLTAERCLRMAARPKYLMHNRWSGSILWFWALWVVKDPRCFLVAPETVKLSYCQYVTVAEQTLLPSITLVDLQLDVQNSYLFTYNIVFIFLYYMYYM